MPIVATPDQIRILREDAHRLVVPAMVVWDLPETARARALMACCTFFDGTQHNHLTEAWTGGERAAGMGYLEERVQPPPGFVASNAAPAAGGWSMRKPDCPHGLTRQVVSRFTDLLLSEVARPMLTTPGDSDTGPTVNQLMESSETWSSLQQARDYKGAMGSSAIVASVVKGEPTSEALMPCHLWVRQWAAVPGWVPEEVIEQKLVTKQVEDPENPGELITENVWKTRVWTTTHEIVYEDVPEDFGEDDDDDEVSEIPVKEENIIEHRAGRCPVVWMQNTRNTASPEGTEDFRGAYQESDKLDRNRSFGVRATIANTDPTLVHSDHDRNLRSNVMRRKGYGATLETSPEGKYTLLETSGASVDMSWNTSERLRHDILQTVACVIMDPETMGSYRSGEALQMLWLAMEARAGRLRVPLGLEIRQIASIWATLAREWKVSSTEEENPTGIVLPPREVKEDGKDTKYEVYQPGKGRYVDVKWGAFHRPTMIQFQAMAGALTTANGAKPVLSQQTATEIAVNLLSLGSPDDELARLEAERESAMKEMQESMKGAGASMFPGLDPEGDKGEARERDAAAGAKGKADGKAAKSDAKDAKEKAEKGKPTAESE